MRFSKSEFLSKFLVGIVGQQSF